MDDLNKQRRKSDMLEHKSDHDLLIRHAVKIDSLCEMMGSMTSKLDLFATRVDDRCSTRYSEVQTAFLKEHDGRMDIVTVRWLIGILVVIIVSVIGAVSYNRIELQKQVSKHDLIMQHIKSNTSDIKQNQAVIESVQSIILNKIEMGG